MLITKLEYIDKKKVKVYIDDEYNFLLYTTDIKKNKMIEGKELSFEVYQDIIENTVFRRAKQKAIAILKYMDRTEYELRNKLKQANYTEEIINRTIEYVISYKYIDDERFAKYYIRTKKSTKSKRQITMELKNKGISKYIIETAFAEFDNDDSAIIKAIRKKTANIDLMSKEEKQKLAASLYRKGFESEDIKKYINSYDD